MKVAVRGSKIQIEELQLVLAADVVVVVFEDIESLSKRTDLDAIFDLSFENYTSEARLMSDLEIPLFVNGVFVNLHEFFESGVFGINALPTFIGRKTLEICGMEGKDTEIQKMAENLGWESVEWVNCRVGMVTPRIICMIINEAFYTVQEGTANREDIDKGMKMGTAYPMGPFEWSEKIGIANIYNVLDSMWQDTREERYKICTLLKTAYLKSLI